MNLRYAEGVEAVIKTGSMTAASKILCITQSGLSQMIKRAERELGAEIFSRGTDPITLTIAGQRYLKAMRQVAAINTGLINEVSEINSQTRGRLRLGISVQRGMQLLPLIMPEFSKRYPKVHIELIEQGSSTLERMLHEGLFDIGLVTTEPHFSDLVYELLETEEVVLIAAKGSRLAQRVKGRQELSIAEAAQEPFIALKPGHSVRRVQDALFAKHMIAPPMLIETDNLEAAKRLAATGAGLMLCPNVYIDQDAELRDRVVCLRLRDMPYKRHFYACWRQNMVLTKFMIGLIGITKQMLENRPARL